MYLETFFVKKLILHSYSTNVYFEMDNSESVVISLGYGLYNGSKF